MRLFKANDIYILSGNDTLEAFLLRFPSSLVRSMEMYIFVNPKQFLEETPVTAFFVFIPGFPLISIECLPVERTATG